MGMDDDISLDDLLWTVKRLYDDAVEEKDAEIRSLRRRIEKAQKTIIALERKLKEREK